MGLGQRFTQATASSMSRTSAADEDRARDGPERGGKLVLVPTVGDDEVEGFVRPRHETVDSYVATNNQWPHRHSPPADIRLPIHARMAVGGIEPLPVG